MSEVKAPEGILCTKSHEYILKEENVYKIGITDHAVEQLGDIVFVELPEVGAKFEKGDVFGTIESVKAASELYIPISGIVAEVNETLAGEPELINNSTYKSGWLIKIEADETDAEKELKEAMEYEDYINDIEE
jgi:glycine cleavage system H protein